MSTPESKVRDPVVKWAKSQGILHVRMAMRPGVASGVPDDLFLLPAGLAVFIEFKRPGKEPTPLQNAKLLRLVDLGYIAFWADDSAGAIGLLKTWTGTARQIPLYTVPEEAAK